MLLVAEFQYVRQSQEVAQEQQEDDAANPDHAEHRITTHALPNPAGVHRPCWLQTAPNYGRTPFRLFDGTAAGNNYPGVRKPERLSAAKFLLTSWRDSGRLLGQCIRPIRQ